MRIKIVYGARGKKEYFIDGKPATEAEFDAAKPTKIDDLLKSQSPPATLAQTSSAWPRKSNSLGVHPKQKKAAEAQAAKFGVPTEFDSKTGQAIIRDNAHQRDLSKALGYHNHDGGYGQVTG